MSQSNQLVQYTHFHNFNSNKTITLSSLHTPSYTLLLTSTFLHFQMPFHTYLLNLLPYTSFHTFTLLHLFSFTCILSPQFFHFRYLSTFSKHSTTLTYTCLYKPSFYTGFHTHIFTIIFFHFHLTSYTYTNILKAIPSFLDLK